MSNITTVFSSSVSSKTDLTKTAIEYIRPIRISFNATSLRPNTRYNIFFDGVNVNRFCFQSGKNTNEPIISSSSGQIIAFFDIPGFTFKTGIRELFVTDSASIFEPAQIIGTSNSYAKALFSSFGILDTFQTTSTTTNITTTIERRLIVTVVPPPPPPPRRGDPLAQSFFTEGFVGGFYVTSIDLFFQSKDTTLPVFVDIRKLVNGYPTDIPLSIDAITHLIPSEVNISNTGSAITKFTFKKMIYLEENSDYCFVVSSASKNYNLWCSRLGQKSLETDNVIFDQPNMGSLFRSENNVTWQPDQFEDIKFVINRAHFNSTSASIRFTLHPNQSIFDGARFKTIKDSNRVVIVFPYKHGLDIGSKVHITCNPSGTFNGVSGTLLNDKLLDVLYIKDDYIVAVTVPGAIFTSHESILYGGVIYDIQVDAGGVGYNAANLPTVHANGNPINATINVTNGSIKSITLNAPLSGYNGHVNITLIGGVGTGAILTAINNAQFGVIANRVYQNLTPLFTTIRPKNTHIHGSLTTTLGRMMGSNIPNYSKGKIYPVNIDTSNYFDNNLLLSSRQNEIAKMAGSSSAVLDVVLSTTNPNVSPVIDLTSSSVGFGEYVVNDIHTDINGNILENMKSARTHGGITTIDVVTGGSGYVTPSVVILGQGSGGSATANVVGGVITSITVNNSGKYNEPPKIFIKDASGTGANAIAYISDYNSELAAANGLAHARYITKKLGLTTPSSRVRMFVAAYSNQQSNFDFYIKPSLASSGKLHDDYDWIKLDCDISRNKSTNKDMFLEYELYKEAIDTFDTFNIKCVLQTRSPWDPPIIKNYRTIFTV